MTARERAELTARGIVGPLALICGMPHQTMQTAIDEVTNAILSHQQELISQLGAAQESNATLKGDGRKLFEAAQIVVSGTDLNGQKWQGHFMNGGPVGNLAVVLRGIANGPLGLP